MLSDCFLYTFPQLVLILPVSYFSSRDVPVSVTNDSQTIHPLEATKVTKYFKNMTVLGERMKTDIQLKCAVSLCRNVRKRTFRHVSPGKIAQSDQNLHWTSFG